MIYKNSNFPYEQRANNLLSLMTLEEKIAQITHGKLRDVISDLENMTFSEEGTQANLPNGIGYLARLGGASDLMPIEIARLANRIQKHFIENTRLGIPVIFMTEATSGVLSRNHTLFPQNISLGAMFNEELVYKMGKAIRDEMLAKGERFALAPVVDLARDPRFGRSEETFGEDIYLISQYGIAYTKGIQGNDLTKGVAATLKHFVGQGINDGGRNCAPIHVSQRELYDQYALPFEATIREADPACIMAAYHEIDNVPVHASKKILTEILKDKLGFKGLLISDGNGINLIKKFHNYCETEEETALLAINAGIEIELDRQFRRYLLDLVKAGKVPERLVDKAVLKVLLLKFKLGLFDNPYVDESKVDNIVCSPKYVSLSKELALESMTLLKNDKKLLPLSKDIKNIAVVGSLANVKEFAYGDYSYPSHIEEMYYESENLTEEQVVARTLFFKKKGTTYEDLFHDTKTILQAIKEKASPDTNIYYAQGIKDTYNYNKDPDFFEIEEAVSAAMKSDVVIAVCGDTSGMGFENDSGESVDRATINLSDEQRTLLRALKKTGKPIILVLCNGRPLELSYESKHMDAILEAWRPGMEGAMAIAEILFGEYNPAGRLPVSLPKTIGQLPIYYSQNPTGKTQFWRDTYLEVDTKPLFPFGYGLSYTSFKYDNILMEQLKDGIKVSLTVTNQGGFDGHEVVQVYARKRFTSVIQPEKELKAYKRIFIEKGEKISLEFMILYDSLCYHNINNELSLENCTLDIMIGASSEDIRAENSFPLEFNNGIRKTKQRIFTNPCKS